MKQFIIFSLLIFSIQSCDLGKGCFKEWTFETPFRLENEKDTYKINDTIWISSYLDHELTDALTGEKSEFPDFGKHQMGITIVELDSVNAIYAQDKFTFIEVQGEYSFLNFSSEQVLGTPGLYTINFEDNPPKYEAKFGLVVNRPGTYFIQIYMIAWTLLDDKTDISECKDYFNGYEVKFSNDSDLNFDLFEPLPKPDYYPTILSEYLDEGFFTFRVEE